MFLRSVCIMLVFVAAKAACFKKKASGRLVEVMETGLTFSLDHRICVLSAAIFVFNGSSGLHASYRNEYKKGMRKDTCRTRLAIPCFLFVVLQAIDWSKKQFGSVTPWHAVPKYSRVAVLDQSACLRPENLSANCLFGGSHFVLTLQLMQHRQRQASKCNFSLFCIVWWEQGYLPGAYRTSLQCIGCQQSMR